MEKLDQTKQKQKKSQKTVGLLKKKVICDMLSEKRTVWFYS